ncbi:MAG: 2-hydroxyacid dehydrogenase [Hamadaea sp.]|nr:2-hydroxyacid dehydrogenase [Hamadaea sp.]
MGPLPGGVDIAFLPNPEAPLPGDPAEVEFWVPPFLSGGATTVLLPRMAALKVVQLLSAGADAWAPRVPAGVALCDARGVHDSSTSEWVVGAILGSLRRFDHFARAQAEGRWAYAEVTPTDELAGKRVLIIGAGSIGAALTRRLEPFEVRLTHVARSARPADGVHGVDELPRLLPEADVVVVLVPLTPATTGLIDKDFLAAMPDGALLVNAARGPVAVTDALVAEVASGRLFAAVDVTDPEPLPADHPLWTLPNALITPHVAGSVRGVLRRGYTLAGQQLRRFVAGEPLVNVVRDGY